MKEFIKEMFKLADWPDGGDIDGFEFQEAAVKHGFLIPEQRTETCGDDCKCAEFFGDDEEWTCYRIAAALTAEQPRDYAGLLSAAREVVRLRYISYDLSWAIAMLEIKLAELEAGA